VGAQTFLPIFGVSAIFDHNFVKIVAPPSDENGQSLVPQKGQSVPKKWKQHQNRP